MSSVSSIIAAVCRDYTGLLHEVISMDVTGISVAVIILGRTPDLAWVHPHACLKVRMAYIDTFIKHSDDD